MSTQKKNIFIFFLPQRKTYKHAENVYSFEKTFEIDYIKYCLVKYTAVFYAYRNGWNVCVAYKSRGPVVLFRKRFNVVYL